jgi:MFS transporter, ACS family, tartrate transporter
MHDVAHTSAIARHTRAHIARRLLPFVFLLFVIAFIDRINLSYVNLDMSRDLRFSDAVFGFGAGIFFFGYLILEIPGALIVERWGAHRWIARIMISWGIVTLFTAFIRTPAQFYTARFLLGLAEAGFLPGVIVYLTHWFCDRDRAKATALFMTAIPVSYIIGSPLAGLVLRLHWFSLPGWRWVFLIEAMPALFFGVFTLFYLTDWPRDARWLTPDERAWITSALDHEKSLKKAERQFTIRDALRNKITMQMTAAYFFSTSALYGFVFWFPTLLKRFSNLPNLQVTLLAALPYILTVLAMRLFGWNSDRTGERRWHAASPLFLSAAALFAAVALHSTHTSPAIVMLCLAAVFLQVPYAILWTIPTAILCESAAAACIGFINSVGCLGGFVAPFVVGYLSTRTGSLVPGLLYLTISAVIGALIILALPARTALSRARLPVPDATDAAAQPSS